MKKIRARVLLSSNIRVIVRGEERPGLALATEPASEPIPKSSSFQRADVVTLVREKRYEEALAVLYRARSESPGDPELQKSIGQIKSFLIGTYAKRLGGLDQIAKPIPMSAARSPDALLVARYIDGASTLDDVAQMCPLGRLRTLQLLLALYSGTDPGPRIDTAPPSGLRTPEPSDPEPPQALLEEERPEPTSPSAIAPVVAAVVETEEDRLYRETFARGTAAFVQRRFEDAVEAFDACDRMRPGDRAASVMLRRSLRDLEGR